MPDPPDPPDPQTKPTAARQTIGAVVMTLVFVLLVGGVGGYAYLTYAGRAGFGPGRSVDALLDRAQSCANRGDYGTALELMTAAIELQPRAPEAYLVRADTYYRFGDHYTAQDDYTSAIDRGGGTRRAFFGRARAREALGELRAAVEDYSRMIEIDPDQAAAYESRGRLQSRLGAHRDAVSDLTRAQTLNPHLRRIDSALAWAHWGIGDYEAALAAFDRALTVRTGRLHNFFGRGVTLYHLDRLPQAISTLSRAASHRQDGRDYAHYYLWLARTRSGDREGADRTLREFLGHPDAMAIGDWSMEIGRFLLGEQTESGLLDRAATGTWMPAEAQMCEACFYAGSLRQLAGERDAARDLFRRGIATNVTNYYEYFSSAEELTRMNQDASGL